MYPQQTILKYSIALVACGVCLLLPNHAAANAENTIQDISPDIKLQGETARLNCTLKRDPDADVQWVRKSDQVIISNNDGIMIEAADNVEVDGVKKFAVGYEKEGDFETFQLVVNRLVPADNGMYDCWIKPSTGDGISKSGFIMVHFPATIALHSVEAKVVAGADYNGLSCTAEGNPEPTITWTRYGSRPIRNGKISITGELALTDIQIDDSGTYVCTAANGIGSPAQMETLFYVFSAPVVEPMEETYSADIGSDPVLICRIQGYPNMTANWRKKPAGDVGDDLTITYLEHNEKYRMDVESIDTRFKDDVAIATEYRMEMRINNIQEDDFGTYECHAVNDRGSGKAEVKLQKRSEVTTVDPASTATKSTPCVVILTLLVMFIKL